jgi:hypothetical protein
MTDKPPVDGTADAKAPEPTRGDQPIVAEEVPPEAPPPAGALYAEDGQAVITAEEHRSAVAKEYGHWVASEDITISGVPAFRRGDPVPKSHVDTGAVPKDSVVGRSTKSAEKLFDELNG